MTSKNNIKNSKEISRNLKKYQEIAIDKGFSKGINLKMWGEKNMRTSGYIICIKMPDCDKYILVHGYSGAVDIVHEDIVKFLKANEGRNKNKLINKELISVNTIKLLNERGYLTDKTLKEEKKYIKKIGKVLHRLYDSKIPGILFIPTYECNLRCFYCVTKHLVLNNGLS